MKKHVPEIICLVVFFSMMFSKSSFAETIYLLTGEVVEGEIVEHNEEYVRIDKGSGIIITYFLDEIKTIGGQAIVSEESVEIDSAEETSVSDIPEPESILEAPRTNDAPEEIIEKQSEAPVIPESVYERYTVDPSSVIRIKNQDASSGEGFLEDQLERRIAERKVIVEQKVLELQEQYPFVGELLEGIKIFGEQTINWTIVTVMGDEDKGPSAVMIIVLLISYALFCFPLMRIAHKLGISFAWLAWVPPLQIFLFLRMANKSFLWIILFFIPVIGQIVIPIILWKEIFESFQKPGWLGIFMVVPILNLIFLWQLALED